MADDVTLPGEGDLVAADLIAGVYHQRMKLQVGADGSAQDVAPGQATMANSLPVVLASDQTAVPVTDNGGSLTVDGPLTDTQLRATAVPVSGTVAVTGPLTDTQLRASAVEMLRTDSTASGNVNNGTTTLAITLNDRAATAVKVSGTWSGTLNFEGTVDGVIWDPIYGVRAGVGIPYTSITETLNDNIFRFTTAGFSQMRVRTSGWNSGNATIAIRSAHATSGVYINFPVPPGENHLGSVGGNTSILDVTPTLDTSAYADGDTLFDTTAVANAVRVSGGSGVVMSVTVHDKTTTNGQALTLFFLRSNVTFGTINASPSISDANQLEIIGSVTIATSDYKTFANNKIACVRNIGLAVAPTTGTTLYIAAQVHGAGTWAASDLVIKIGILRD